MVKIGSTTINYMIKTSTTKFNQKEYIKYWQCRSKEDSSLEKRMSNLIEFSNCIEKLKINYWLYDRTLLFAFKVKLLSPDVFDQVAIWGKDIDYNDDFYKQLNIKEFEIVKKSKKEMWLLRKKRVLIVKYFSNNNSLSRVNDYNIDVKYFFNLDKIQLYGFDFKIPNKTSHLLQEIYAPNLYNKILRFFYALLNGNFILTDFVRKVFFMSFSKVPRVKVVLLKYIFYIRYKKIPGSFYYVKKLSIQDFYDLELDFDVEFNWIFRRRHLGLITDNGKHRKISQIINYLKTDGVLEKIKLKIEETPMDNLFYEPICWSRRFWNTGNNYFIYPLLYGFIKHVYPYDKVNRYIKKNRKPPLFSKEYYDSLSVMYNDEIKKTLKNNPLEIIGKGFSSGRHRACAMIGRLVRGEPYIPIYAIILPEK